ncbi:MAG: Ig-like domain-containing protein [Smithella sp.]|nr:Ig-like domain-containing protein [Smithella sp.]
MSTLTLRPNSDVTIEQTRSSGSYSYALVDEAVKDESDYNKATNSTDWDINLYGFPNHTTETGNISSVVVHAVCETNNSPDDYLKLAIKIGSTTYYGSTVNIPNDDTTDWSYTWNTNPSTRNPWTWSDIDALVAGVSLYADIVDLGHYLKNYQLYVEVNYTAPLTLSLSDTITISDSIAKATRTTKADLLSIADEISKVATFVRQIADSVSVSDSISKKSQIVFADEVTIADEMSRLSSYNLSFADVMVIFDDMGMRSPGNYFLLFNEILSISDSIIKSVEFGIEDTLTVEDDMSRIVAYERLIADTITVSDDMTHSKVVLRTINIVANSMLKNATQQVSVIGVYSDESASDVTQFCSFATSDIDIATIDSGGLITSISEGLVTITATLGDLTTTYVLAVISESQSAALMTGIVSFANGDTYRTASYLSRRHVFKTNSISLVKVLASKYPVTIELVFPDIPLAIPVTVENKNPVRVKSFLMEAVEVRIAPAEEVTAVFLASTMEELTL